MTISDQIQSNWVQQPTRQHSPGGKSETLNRLNKTAPKLTIGKRQKDRTTPFPQQAPPPRTVPANQRSSPFFCFFSVFISSSLIIIFFKYRLKKAEKKMAERMGLSFCISNREMWMILTIHRWLAAGTHAHDRPIGNDGVDELESVILINASRTG